MQKPKRPRGRPRISSGMRRLIEGKLDRWSPQEVWKGMRDEGVTPLPSVRTIARIKHELPRDLTESWTLGKSSLDSLPVVPNLLATLVVTTGGKKAHVTLAEAEWVTRVALAAPDLFLQGVYQVARAYMVVTHHKRPTTDLDWLLAFQPWRSEEHFSTYIRAVNTVHPEWIHTTAHEPVEDATPEEMMAALGHLELALGVVLAMQLRKGARDDQTR